MFVSVAPPDFSSVSEELVLTPDDPRVCFNITVDDDEILEIDEYFNTTLVGDLPPAAVFNITSATVLLEDNECEFNSTNHLCVLSNSVFSIHSGMHWTVERQCLSS